MLRPVLLGRSMIKLEALSKRFAGLDFQYNRDGFQWPKPWRLQLFTSENERDKLRLASYGNTPDEAIKELLIMIEDNLVFYEQPH